MQIFLFVILILFIILLILLSIFAAPVVAGTVEDPKNIAGTRGATGEQVDVRRH
jgi:hypothetical protein